jgi:uncharacterized protein YacL
MSVAIITLFLRWTVVILMLWCGLEIWRTTTSLQSKSLKQIVKKIALGVIAFAVGRLVASLLDNYLAYDIGIFSNIANYAFWFWVLFYVYKNRKRVQSEAIGDVGRERLSNFINEIIVEMKLERDRHIT